jgi:large subunit ribosomal protein L10
MLLGPTAITFITGDAVVAAKALRDFAKGHEALVVKGGLLGDRTLDPADLVALADVAPREELLARLAGGFQAPLVKAAGLFQALPRSFAYGVKALIDQRVAGGEALPTPAEAPAPDAAPAESAETAEPAAEAEAPAEAATETEGGEGSNEPAADESETTEGE